MYCQDQYELCFLTEDVYDLIAQTSIELGHKTDGKTMAALSKIFAKDLQLETRFQNLYFQDVKESFRIGVRYSEQQQFLNISTFYRWLLAHKKRIDNAIYNVETCGADETKELYYRKQKLLK